ncbi:MAG TPA: DUF3306 domain-containing protein [Ramlibacter sp.]|nr:DUF3306 domain-containing protein [Ramlibacter sp.]
MADGFLGRWSRRKLDQKEGKPVDDVPAPAPPPAAALPVVPPVAARDTIPSDAPPVVQPEPPPTLEEAQALTPDSDFARFVSPDVQPEVKNAAMKKLFADPHFNVMDRLDVYIDDYSQPDPMPESMLRSLASAEFLGFFRDEQRMHEAGPGARVGTDDPRAEIVSQSDAAAIAMPEALSGIEPAPTADPTESPAQDADPDLRLQQDHAPGPQGPGHGAQ